jgi:hypothetical protein
MGGTVFSAIHTMDLFHVVFGSHASYTIRAAILIASDAPSARRRQTTLQRGGL